METKNQHGFKKMGLIGILACGFCCVLPILGAVAGIGALTALGVYLEKIAIVILGIAGIMFVLHLHRKKKLEKECTTSCETDCDCKDEVALKRSDSKRLENMPKS